MVYARNGVTRGLPYLGVHTLLSRIDVSTAYWHVRRASLQVASERAGRILGGAACSMQRMATPLARVARSVKWENPSKGWAGQRVVEAPPVVAILEILHSLCSSLQRSINPIMAPLFCLCDERCPREECHQRWTWFSPDFSRHRGQKPKPSRGDTRSQDLQKQMRDR